MGKDDVSKEVIGAAEMEELSLDDLGTRVSRNFLQGFGGGEGQYGAVKVEEEEIELNLALSLGGGFGVDKACKKLIRSSSTGGVLPVCRGDHELAAANPVAVRVLARTSSLPIENEEQWRKRKELQSLRRMEAKRRRFEKQRNVRSDKEDKSGLPLRGGIPVGVEAAMAKGKQILVGSDKQGFLPPISRGSVESKGGSSSSLSELENNPLQVSSGEVSTTDIQSSKLVSNQIADTLMKGTTESNTTTSSKRTDPTRTRGSSSAEDMPCVFTVGNGPQGRRVEGILYRYGRHEEVRIMCVCCGDFHSPVEFVKHAGGIDLDNPLKHIVVNPNSSSFF